MVSHSPTKSSRGRRFLRFFLTALGLLVVVIALAGFVLFGFSPVPAHSTYPLDIAQVRQLAQADSSLLPVRLNAVNLGAGVVPQAVVFAGGSLQQTSMPVPVFQVIYPDHTVIVDAGMDKASFDQMFTGGWYSTKNYNQLQDAMRQCQAVLFTHEHLDHIAGLTHSPHLDELYSKTIFTSQQLGALPSGNGLNPDQLARFTPLDYGQYQQFAPGMVLIKAAGHSPGSQMVYLRMQDGREYLLVGDVVWSAGSLTHLSGRPLFISLQMGEDWSAARSQVRTLYDLSQSEQLYLLISHDYDQVHSYIQQGLVGDAFE